MKPTQIYKPSVFIRIAKWLSGINFNSDHSEYPEEYVGNRAWQEYQQAVIPQRVDFLLPFTKGGVLDVGAGDGMFADAIKAKGVDVECIEVSKVEVEKLKNKGYTVYSEFPKNKTYGVTHASAVLEHVDDPKSLLMSMALRTNHDGAIWISSCDEKYLLGAVAILKVITFGLFNATKWVSKWHMQYIISGPICQVT